MLREWHIAAYGVVQRDTLVDGVHLMLVQTARVGRNAITLFSKTRDKSDSQGVTLHRGCNVDRVTATEKEVCHFASDSAL